MTVVAKLDALTRKVPGVSGYLDRENARAADKALREHLAVEIGRLRRTIDAVVRTQAERRVFAVLPLLDRLGTKLDTIASSIRFAGQGYRPIFDREQVDAAALQRLYEYDRDLTAEIATVRAHVETLSSAEDEGAIQRDAQVLEKLLDTFADVVQRRQDVLSRAE
jgi:hypothetical protein